MKAWVLLIMGMVLPYLLTTIVPVAVVGALLLLVLFLICMRRYLVYVLLPVGFLITTIALSHRLAQRLSTTDEQASRLVTGIIGSLPDYRTAGAGFDFLPDAKQPRLPPIIRVYWYAPRARRTNARHQAFRGGLPQLHAGERWQLQLELRTTKGRVNFHGADSERWRFARNIGALASVQAGRNLRLNRAAVYNLARWRERVLARLRLTGSGVPAFRLLEALAIGDRRALSGTDRAVLAATGTGHLLAISGLHIGLAASMGYYLGRLGLLLLPVGQRQRLAVQLPWLASWLAAASYAALAGFGVSTQRALIMLGVVTLVVLSRRSVHPLLGWLIAMALVLLLDPFAPLRAGFWFSFTAVAVLLMLFVPRFGRLPAWRKVVLAQLGISLVMAPLGMLWFHQVSLPGLAANLVAIPVVSFVVVPLLLLALLFLGLPLPLAAGCLSVAGQVADRLMVLLARLAAFQPESLSATPTPGLLSAVLAMGGAALLFLPRGLPVRLAGLLLLLPLVFASHKPLSPGQVQIDLLDVGQGLSVLVSVTDYLLVYDTGPGNGLAGEARWDMVAGTIEPMIRAGGRRPDVIVVSHADLDHAGGLAGLQLLYPQAHYLANLRRPRAGVTQCTAPAAWSSGHLHFRVLHPSASLPYLGNDSSCVISMHMGSFAASQFSLLLSGDISQAVESRLVSNGLGQHRVLIVPHHGSSTSSSQRLLDQLKPGLALISSAPANRFGFPRDDVLSRYAVSNVRVLNSADCGGIRVVSDAEGQLEVKSARRVGAAIWRWPAAPVCP